jgi:hypothetical protein
MHFEQNLMFQFGFLKNGGYFLDADVNKVIENKFFVARSVTGTQLCHNKQFKIMALTSSSLIYNNRRVGGIIYIQFVLGKRSISVVTLEFTGLVLLVTLCPADNRLWACFSSGCILNTTDQCL